MSAPASVPAYVRIIAEGIRLQGLAERRAMLERQAAAIASLKGGKS